MKLDELKKPFPSEKISWRVGPTSGDKSSGIALAYIDARDVMERLDEVCGVDGWQCRYPHANGKTVCEIGIKVAIGADLAGPRLEWVWKADGAGDTDMEAEKGALSDAFKRAAVRWGIGRYLYDVENTWVKIEPAGKSYKIAQHEYARLRAMLEGKKPPKQPYQDEDGQGQNWIEEQKTFLKSCKTVADIEGWVESRKDALGRLRRQNLPAWNELRQFKENRIGNINLENVKV